MDRENLKLSASINIFADATADNEMVVVVTDREHRLLAEARLSSSAARAFFWAALKMIEACR